MTIQETARQAAQAEYMRPKGPSAYDGLDKIADAVAVAVLQELFAAIPGDDGRAFIQSYLDRFDPSPEPAAPSPSQAQEPETPCADKTPGCHDTPNGWCHHFTLTPEQGCDCRVVPPAAPSPSDVEQAAEWVCEVHPWLEWPHNDCPGPGCPVTAQGHLAWVRWRDVVQERDIARTQASEASRHVVEQAAEIERLKSLAAGTDRAYQDLQARAERAEAALASPPEAP